MSLLKQLCLGTPHMTIRLVSRLAALLPQASIAGKHTTIMHHAFPRPSNECKMQHRLLICHFSGWFELSSVRILHICCLNDDGVAAVNQQGHDN